MFDFSFVNYVNHKIKMDFVVGQLAYFHISSEKILRPVRLELTTLRL